MYECSVIVYSQTVESTLPWWICQGVEALDNYEHFACCTGQTHMARDLCETLGLRSASIARV